MWAWLQRYDPLFYKRMKRFVGIGRARRALILLCIGFVLSLFAEIIANKNPLVVSYKGSLYFPFLTVYQGHDFGWDSVIEPQYKDQKEEIVSHGWYLPPLVWWGVNESNDALDRYPSPPGVDNWLGTDDRGRDVFVRLLYGFRLSMMFAVFTLFVALFLGTMIGGLQGFFGGLVDLIGQRFVEIWVSLPPIFVVILIVNVLQPNLWVLLLTISAFSWISAQYYIRGESLRLKNMDYTHAAKTFGSTRWQIFKNHIVPNAMTPMITLIPFVMNQSILFLSFLDFMGLGVQAPTASIGELLRQGRENFLEAWWLAFFPFFILVVTLLLLSFVGEGVRQAFDPRAVEG
ncbi:MAG: ABC transporter permease subunit [Oligoflexales bacterium]